jgi:hypothetical protein
MNYLSTNNFNSGRILKNYPMEKIFFEYSGNNIVD